MLHTLATLPTHPESVPINALVAVKGTPLQEQKVNIIIFIAAQQNKFGISNDETSFKIEKYHVTYSGLLSI